jgi:hypothetical protein
MMKDHVDKNQKVKSLVSWLILSEDKVENYNLLFCVKTAPIHACIKWKKNKKVDDILPNRN